MTTRWMKNRLQEPEATRFKPRGMKLREGKSASFRFDEAKIQAAHAAYLREKELNRTNANQYGYAGQLRMVQG